MKSSMGAAPNPTSPLSMCREEKKRRRAPLLARGPWSSHHFATFTDVLCAARILRPDWRLDLQLPRVWHLNERNHLPPADGGFDHTL